MTEETQYNINEIQAQLTASKVLVAVLETLGKVHVPTANLISATNEDKELLVDYNPEVPEFIFSVFDREGNNGPITINID